MADNRTINKTALNFGFATLAVLRDGELRGIVELPGSIEGEITEETVSTSGGPYSWAVAGRKARTEGKITISVNECPSWFDTEFGGASETVVVANASGAVGTARAASSGGDTVATHVTLTITDGAKVRGATVIVSAKTESTADVTVIGPTGARTFEGLTLTTSEAALGATGLSIEKSSTALAPGDSAVWSVYAPNQGGSVLRYTATQETLYHELIAYSTVGGKHDSVVSLRFPCVIVNTVNTPRLMDNESGSSGVELTAQIFAPTDGTAPYERTLLKVGA